MLTPAQTWYLWFRFFVTSFYKISTDMGDLRQYHATYITQYDLVESTSR